MSYYVVSVESSSLIIIGLISNFFVSCVVLLMG